DSYSWNDNSVSANVSWRKSDQDEITTGGVSWRRPYKGVNVSLGYQAVHSKKDNDSDNRFFVTLSRNFGERGSVRARTATGPNESEIEWRKLSTRSIGASAARASYKFGEQQDELSADASYIASRAEIDVGHNSIIEGGEIITASTNVRLGMGFGFADGSFAFGRPVANGFYILQGHPTLKGHEISAYQGRDQMTGKTGLFGPALVPLNGAYREQVYRVDIEDLPIGYDMGSGQVQMFPSFNSGYRIKIGSDPTTLVIGRIHGADGEPVKLGFGKLIRVGSDAGTIEPIEFFTNRTGRFVAERVKAGTYALILQPGDRNIGQITVTEGEDGVQQIGTLTIKETP
ncbi:MAG: fimbria/pilus outer membrane usher protein, partial [Robiginitomaculum sp.]